MPVFVEWEWKERTKSFLVIFHFYDDFSKPNLRVKKCGMGKGGRLMIVVTAEGPILPQTAWMSWAPSHSELALLSELLSYANIVNGLKESTKRELRVKLEVWKKGNFIEDIGEYEPDVWVAFVPKVGTDKHVVYLEKREDSENDYHLCIQLSHEYIDYLKNLLKPYLS